jgi:hypothetical protein
MSIAALLAAVDIENFTSVLAEGHVRRRELVAPFNEIIEGCDVPDDY